MCNWETGLYLWVFERRQITPVCGYSIIKNEDNTLTACHMGLITLRMNTHIMHPFHWSENTEIQWTIQINLTVYISQNKIKQHNWLGMFRLYQLLWQDYRYILKSDQLDPHNVLSSPSNFNNNFKQVIEIWLIDEPDPVKDEPIMKLLKLH